MELANLTHVPDVVFPGQERDISAPDVVHSLNYGGTAVFRCLNSTWGLYKGHTSTYCIWDKALVFDLAESLFQKGNVLDRTNHTGYCEGITPTFIDRCNSEERHVLLETLGKFSHTFAGGNFMFPHSYLVAGLLRFISYLREGVKVKHISSDAHFGAQSFMKESAEIWKSIFCTLLEPLFAR
jgi:hypothetical protein